MIVILSDYRFDTAEPLFCVKLSDALGIGSPPVQLIITSPPYSQIIPILRNALTIATRYFIMKSPLSFMIITRGKKNFWGAISSRLHCTAITICCM